MTDKTLEAVAHAIKAAQCCGLTLLNEKQEYVLCDDPRLDDDLRQKVCDCRNSATAAIAAYQQAAPAPQPRVKPLVWEKQTYSYETKRDQYVSITLVGKCVITDFSDLGYFEWVNRNGGLVEKCDTLEAAKAAAQADYETRILSALEAAPTPEAGQ